MTPARFWFFVAVCCALIVAPASGVFEHRAFGLMALIGMAGIPLALVARAVRAVVVRLTEGDQAAREAHRLRELKDQLQAGQVIQIDGLSRLPLVLALALIAALLTSWATKQPEWHVIAFAATSWLVTLLILIQAAPQIGKPVLIITHDGIETPAYGKFLWRDIAGFDLEAVRAEGSTIAHHLVVAVPKINEHREQMHAAARLMRTLFRHSSSQLRLWLSALSEPPQVILAICRDTWSRSTGRDARWGADMSPRRQAAEDLIRRNEHELSEMKRAMEISNRDPDAANEIMDALAEQRRDTGGAGRENARKKIAALFAEKGPREALRELRARSEERRRQLENFEPPRPRTHWFTWVVGVLMVGCFAFAFRIWLT